MNVYEFVHPSKLLIGHATMNSATGNVGLRLNLRGQAGKRPGTNSLKRAATPIFSSQRYTTLRESRGSLKTPVEQWKNYSK